MSPNCCAAIRRRVPIAREHAILLGKKAAVIFSRGSKRKGDWRALFADGMIQLWLWIFMAGGLLAAVLLCVYFLHRH